MGDEASNRIPTNEEIIDDLTKDLRDSQISIDSLKSEQTLDSSHLEAQSESADSVSDDSDDEALKNQDLELSDEEKEVRREDALILKNRGNEEFKNGDYLESINTYTEALQKCPLKFPSDRAVLYANRAASKMQVERKESAIDDCTKAITLNDTYVKAYVRRAKLYEETDKLDESLEDYKKILEMDPGNKEALSATQRLPPLINERNEKLKTEMMDKLKDLGNIILRPFGLSTSNFKLQQDPSTGGYSVNFQQNPTS